MIFTSGSPPHTRGIPFHRVSRAPHLGFTPAYAGNTLFLCLILRVYLVHPRIRGEYRKSTTDSAILRGSPPHTRGILLLISSRLKPWLMYRFTPAYAGNTRNPHVFGFLQKVHPRIRGEYH